MLDERNTLQTGKRQPLKNNKRRGIILQQQHILHLQPNKNMNQK